MQGRTQPEAEFSHMEDVEAGERSTVVRAGDWGWLPVPVHGKGGQRNFSLSSVGQACSYPCEFLYQVGRVEIEPGNKVMLG